MGNAGFQSRNKTGWAVVDEGAAGSGSNWTVTKGRASADRWNLQSARRPEDVGQARYFIPSLAMLAGAT